MMILLWIISFLEFIMKVDAAFTSCADVKKYNPQAPDGEYRLVPAPLRGRSVIVYCHKMFGTPLEFISLKQEAISVQPECLPELLQNTTFSKIRVNITTMVVIRSDYTFARYHGERIPFGDVQTCVNRDMECHTEGYVMYDTAGTGLVLDDVMYWDPNKLDSNKHKATWYRNFRQIVATVSCPVCPCQYQLKKTIKLVPYRDLTASSCSELKHLEGVTEDGDYKLNVLGRRVAIYCYNMTGTPAEYVSLPVDNIGKVHDISCTNKSRPLEVGWTTFTKIRLDIRTLTVDRHDFTFTVSRGINLAWAETGLCHGPEKYSDCRLLIMSVLDLQDTGLRLDMGREDTKRHLMENKAESQINEILEGIHIVLLCKGVCSRCASRGTVRLTHIDLPGQWSSWQRTFIGECDKLCERTVTMNRTCTNPRPKYGGRYCPGFDVREVREPCFGSKCEFIRPENCSSLLERDGKVIDREYTLFPLGFFEQPVVIYCHDMLTFPREYITLKYYNGGKQKNCLNVTNQNATTVNEYRATKFLKLRINLKTMEVNTTDFTFAVSTGEPVPWGEPGSVGYFVMDLRDTGFHIGKKIQWLKRGPEDNFQANKSYIGQKMHVQCNGPCVGLCKIPRFVTIGPFPVKPSTCSDMKRLGESADGEYRLYPHIFGGQATFVYCHNMHHAVPQEYVTLQFLNGQQYEPTGDCSGKGYWISGATYFNKIRVNIDTMDVNTTDYTFATSYGKRIPWGDVRDMAVLDTRGTGLVVDPGVAWMVRLSKANVEVTKRHLGQTLELKCKESCGRCKVRRPIQLSLFVGNPANCSQIQEMNGYNENGDYQVYPKRLNGRSIYVYCDFDMDTAKEFLTLSYYNGGRQQACDYPKVRSSNFTKLRINIETLEVINTDYSFASSLDVLIPWGEPGECYNDDDPDTGDQCDYKMHFTIDTRGTGLKVDPKIQWESPETNIRVSTWYDGQTLYVTCNGTCESCQLNDSLRLVSLIDNGNHIAYSRPSQDDPSFNMTILTVALALGLVVLPLMIYVLYRWTRIKLDDPMNSDQQQIIENRARSEGRVEKGLDHPGFHSE